MDYMVVKPRIHCSLGGPGGEVSIRLDDRARRSYAENLIGAGLAELIYVHAEPTDGTIEAPKSRPSRQVSKRQAKLLTDEVEEDTEEEEEGDSDAAS